MLGGCDGLARTDFQQFLIWPGVVVLKEPIFHHSLLWEGVMVLKELNLTIYTLGGGLDRIDFSPFATLGLWWS